MVCRSELGGFAGGEHRAFPVFQTSARGLHPVDVVANKAVDIPLISGGQTGEGLRAGEKAFTPQTVCADDLVLGKEEVVKGQRIEDCAIIGRVLRCLGNPTGRGKGLILSEVKLDLGVAKQNVMVAGNRQGATWTIRANGIRT